MAFLPNVGHAVVETQKVTDYLLSETHPQGAGKARFFLAFGFSADRLEVFRAAVLDHAGCYEVSACEPNRYGTKYVIEGPLASPDGRHPMVRCIWFVETGEVTPRLVTVVPLGSVQS